MNLLRPLLPAIIGIPLCLAFGADEPLIRRELRVDGVAREALLHVPAQAKDKPCPVVFAFHGHGGNMNHSARTFGYHLLWPEAIVIYPQGLNTPGRLTDPEGKKPGWQGSVGDQGDRDLKFFDAMLADLRANHQVDDRRIYSTGHSNGGGFTYLLWAARGDVFAAVAPSAAV
jgi:polyhydroxybutyrate depolymerase